MRDAAGEAAERFHLARLLQVGLEPFAVAPRLRHRRARARSRPGQMVEPALTRKSCAPALMAATAVSSPEMSEMMMNGSSRPVGAEHLQRFGRR